MNLHHDQRGGIGAVLVDTIAVIVVVLIWFSTSPILDAVRGQAEVSMDDTREEVENAFDMWDWFMMLWPIPVIVGIVIHMFVSVSTPTYETGRRW